MKSELNLSLLQKKKKKNSTISRTQVNVRRTSESTVVGGMA